MARKRQLLQGREQARMGRSAAKVGLVLPCRGRRQLPGLIHSLAGEIRASENSYFCQAARQLASVPSSQLCVKLASGGDPTYAFNIRFTGEEVHGTSEWPQADAVLG